MAGEDGDEGNGQIAAGHEVEQQIRDEEGGEVDVTRDRVSQDVGQHHVPEEAQQPG